MQSQITCTMKKETQEISTMASVITSTLPKVLLRTCMEYAGKGNFLFITPVSKEFHDSYTSLYPHRETSPKGFASDSIQCSKMCLGTKNKSFTRNLLRWAAIKGHSDIVEHIINHCRIPRNVFYNYEDRIGRHLEVLKIIHKHKFMVNWNECCIGAMEAKCDDVTLWIFNNINEDNVIVHGYLSNLRCR